MSIKVGERVLLSAGRDLALLQFRVIPVTMMNSIPADTDPTAFEAQLEFYRRIGPEGRVRLACQMSEEAREISKAGIRLRHPDYSEDQVSHALYRLTLGDELYHAAWPQHELVQP